MAMAPNSEEITCGIQKAIVTLCMEAYSSGTEVEIDGIICLRDTKHKQYEVVKIHKTFIKPDLGNATLASFGNATFGNATLAGFENPSPGKQTTPTTENNASSNSRVIRDRDKITSPCSVSSKEMTGPFSFNRKEMTVRKYELCEEKQKQFSQHSKVVSEEVILDSPVSHNGYMYSSKDGGDSVKQANDLENPFISKPVASDGQNMYLDHTTVNTTTLPVVAADCKRETVQVDRRPTTVVKDDQTVSSELLMEISLEQNEDEKEAEDEKKEGEREEQNRTFNEELEDDGDCIIVKIETQDDENNSDEVVALREIPISAENLAFHLTSFDSQKQSSMIRKNLSHGRKRSLSNTYILDTKKTAGMGSDLSENEAGNQSNNSLAHDDNIHGGFHRNVFYSSHDNTLVSSIELNDCMSGGVVSTTPPLSKLQKLMSLNTSDSETRFSCFLCGMQFVTKSNLFRHMRSSCKLVGRKAPCQVCGKMLLDRPDNLKEHMLSQHGVERNLKDISDVDEADPLPRS